jgi:hypothetical protein
LAAAFPASTGIEHPKQHSHDFTFFVESDADTDGDRLQFHERLNGEAGPVLLNMDFPEGIVEGTVAPAGILSVFELPLGEVISQVPG